MPPFAPEGNPAWTEVIQALLVPLAVFAACASVVWGLQDRLAAVTGVLRTLTGEFRRPDAPLRRGGLKEGSGGAACAPPSPWRVPWRADHSARPLPTRPASAASASAAR